MTLLLILCLLITTPCYALRVPLDTERFEHYLSSKAKTNLKVSEMLHRKESLKPHEVETWEKEWEIVVGEAREKIKLDIIQRNGHGFQHLKWYLKGLRGNI